MPLCILLLCIHHSARYCLCVLCLFSSSYSVTEPERPCVQLIPYLLSKDIMEKFLAIAFASEDQYLAYNVFAILSRVFWTSLPSGRNIITVSCDREVWFGW